MKKIMLSTLIAATVLGAADASAQAQRAVTKAGAPVQNIAAAATVTAPQQSQTATNTKAEAAPVKATNTSKTAPAAGASKATQTAPATKAAK